MRLQEIDLSSLFDSSNMLWVSGLLMSLPILLMVVIAVAATHGRRARKAREEES